MDLAEVADYKGEAFLNEKAILTNHGSERLCKRGGLKKKSLERVANKALEKGIRHSEATGSLKKYLDKLYLTHRVANNMRVYAGKVYLFKENVLVTVLDLPSKYSKTVESVKKKRTDEEKAAKKVQKKLLNQTIFLCRRYICLVNY